MKTMLGFFSERVNCDNQSALFTSAGVGVSERVEVCGVQRKQVSQEQIALIFTSQECVAFVQRSVAGK